VAGPVKTDRAGVAGEANWRGESGGRIRTSSYISDAKRNEGWGRFQPSIFSLDSAEIQ
jgi:hypothetical protein